jgi:hypothetical protein
MFLVGWYMTIHDVISHLNYSGIKDSDGEYMCTACVPCHKSHMPLNNFMEVRNDEALRSSLYLLVCALTHPQGIQLINTYNMSWLYLLVCQLTHPQGIHLMFTYNIHWL